MRTLQIQASGNVYIALATAITTYIEGKEAEENSFKEATFTIAEGRDGAIYR